MSSPAGTSADKHEEQQNQRPGSSRHGSSWLNRLHRHHDRKHHTFMEEQERPLLATDPDMESRNEPSEEDTEAQAPLSLQRYPRSQQVLLNVQNKLRNAYEVGRDRTTRAYQATRRSSGRNLKHILIACVFGLLALLIALGIGFLLHHKARGKPSTCTTAACVHAASKILYNLDPKYAEIDPCTNFDKYACGGFEQRHLLRPNQVDMFTGTLMAEQSQRILRQVLESDPSSMSSADQVNFNKLKADYGSCMDEAIARNYGIKPLKALIQHIKISLPILLPAQVFIGPVRPMAKDAAQHSVVLADDSNPLTNVLIYMLEKDIMALLSIGVRADDRNPESQVIFVDPPRKIGLPSKEYYEDNDTVADYETMATGVLGNFFEEDPDNTTRPLSRTNRSLKSKRYYNFRHTRLAAATPSKEEQNDVTKSYNQRSVTELETLLPQLSFDKIIKQLAPMGYAAEKVIVGSPNYMKSLSDLLSSTPRDTLQAFLVWKAVQEYAPRIVDSALKPMKQFNNKLRGMDPDAAEDRWLTCINAVDEDLGWILSKFFVDQAFSTASKDFGDQVVSDVKDSFITLLKGADWMTGQVRERAISKVHAIEQKIGYPKSNPDIMNPRALQEYYREVTIENTAFFENKVQVAQFQTRRKWSKLGKPTEHDEWDTTLPSVNAYYNPAGNEIVFPAGILQNPVFHGPNVPSYLTYGAFGGAVSGHQLFHAFDNTGSQYDEAGRYVEWWDNTTRQAFDNKTSCFADQYSNFTVSGPDNEPIHINGRLTLGENVADAGGLHAAFLAWKKRNDGSQALPGLSNFTNEQLFFVNYANWWCGTSTNERAIQKLYTDPHAPKWSRILGTLDNSAAFKEAFNCPSKKPVCEIW